jgi:hypothetical protein
MMQSVFTDIELEWEGRLFIIKPHKVMGAIARIEEHITLAELQAYSQKGTAPLAKLCMAYGAVLRYAGAAVSDDAVYAKAFDEPEAQQVVMTAVMNLMQMMLPAQARARLQELMNAPDEAPDGETPTGNPPATAKASLSKPTKRRSRKAAG